MSIEFLGIDTETTGLVAGKNQIVDICLLLIDGNFEVQKELQIYALHDADAVLDPGALKVNGYDPDEWRNKGAMSQVAMATAVYEFLKPHSRLKLIAHNVSFDKGFLEALLLKHADPSQVPFGKMVDYHSLDSMCIAMFLDYVNSGKARKSYRLGALTADYSIEHTAAHEARGDIYACLNLLKAMRDAVKGTLAVAPGAMKEGSSFSKIIIQTNSESNIWEFHHGAHKGRTVQDVACTDVSYIRHVLSFNDLSPAQRAHLEHVYREKTL